MILISNDFWHKIKLYNFDPYNVLLAIATNIPVLLMTVRVRCYDCICAAGTDVMTVSVLQGQML